MISYEGLFIFCEFVTYEKPKVFLSLYDLMVGLVYFLCRKLDLTNTGYSQIRIFLRNFMLRYSAKAQEQWDSDGDDRRPVR